jgi:hypothetical protein
MSNKEKVEIRRSDQFQEVDEELTRAMAELDSTIERVSMIFQANADAPELENVLEAIVEDGLDNQVEGSEAVGAGKRATTTPNEQE